jgi:simple sugar transport system permease protein
MIEVTAVHGRGNESLNAGYGYVGILVAFLSRQSPTGILAVSLLVGGLLASSGMLQRTQDLPDATVTVLQGLLFLFILLSDTVYARISSRRPKPSAVAA